MTGVVPASFCLASLYSVAYCQADKGLGSAVGVSKPDWAVKEMRGLPTSPFFVLMEIIPSKAHLSIRL
jgi:hypothetical protein